MKKYELIATNLVNQFQAGTIQIGEKLPTEQQLMQSYNVSRITVRLAMNLLEEKGLITRTAGKGTFYTGSIHAREGKKITIALIILFSVNELLRIAEGITATLNDSDGKLLTYISNGNPEYERELCRKIIEEGTDGIIIFPVDEISNREFFSDLEQRGYPLIFIDRSPLTNCNLIQANNELGMYLMTEYLISCGHKRIAYISSFSYSVLRDRFRGFSNAMKKHNLTVTRDSVVALKKSPTTVSDNPENIYDEVEKLARQDNPPTAIICSNDIIALHAINKLRKMGEPYNKISITGFDNATYSSKNAYSITTIEQDFNALGSTAIQTMLEIINNPRGKTYRIQTPVRIIKRDSVYPIE